jgi:hypothetical protein
LEPLPRRLAELLQILETRDELAGANPENSNHSGEGAEEAAGPNCGKQRSARCERTSETLLNAIPSFPIAGRNAEFFQGSLSNSDRAAFSRLRDLYDLFGDYFGNRVRPICQPERAQGVLIGRDHSVNVLLAESRILQ